MLCGFFIAPTRTLPNDRQRDRHLAIHSLEATEQAISALLDAINALWERLTLFLQIKTPHIQKPSPEGTRPGETIWIHTQSLAPKTLNSQFERFCTLCASANFSGK